MFHNPMGRALYQQRGLRGRGIPQDLQTALTSSFPVWTQMPQGGGDAVEYVRFAALKQSTSAVRTAVRVSLGQAGAAALVRSLASWADLLLQPLAERAPVFRLDEYCNIAAQMKQNRAYETDCCIGFPNPDTFRKNRRRSGKQKGKYGVQYTEQLCSLRLAIWQFYFIQRLMQCCMKL